jgi:SAM-dependent methyltransferase
MAKFEIHHPAKQHFPAFTEAVEARVWGLGGTPSQAFYLGSGLNFKADGNYWLEIIYSVEGAQIFYTRNFLHYLPYDEPGQLMEEILDKMLAEGEGSIGFGDIMPETFITFKMEKRSYTNYDEDENEVEEEYTSCSLEIAADTSSVFGRSPPGERWLKFLVPFIEADDGARFMRDLIHEVAAVKNGNHPDPAGFPVGSSEWPFLWQLNSLAYDRLSSEYQEDYFNHGPTNEAFERWLSQITPGGQILDAGCGHGRPVFDRLLERGFQVTGSDISARMLQRARQQFPQARFLHTTISALGEESAFDAACSFNSLLYLDPIDMLNSVHRLHRALKPGGLLFLWGYDSGPDWRGEPFGYRLKHWMWSWHYGMEEAAGLLEEHGYFEVLEMRKVVEDEDESARIAVELEKQKQEQEEYNQRRETDPEAMILPFIKTPVTRSVYAYILIAWRCDDKVTPPAAATQEA